ncbi:MAG: hypothetical protein J6A75_12165 [Lachnospiraceae bacterium]|nr:hypothetical protein [Lachnospiraceae bacterium]
MEIHIPFVKNNVRIFGTITNIILVGITIAFVKGSHQNLDSIGLYNDKWKQSIGMGCILAAILFFNNCLSHILEGSNFIPTKKIVILVIFYICVALAEEIVFRGYIGTRIYGAIIPHWISNLAYNIVEK